ncbi:hypothetical protein [Terrimonas alba]|uniref:hypothetical protein n=1 Tax=Terrimonas alba TaxID=3349636 RepID=UPI0035F4013F
MQQETLNYDDEPVVLPDECGDTLWDVVLQQEANNSAVKGVTKNAISLLNSIDAVQVSDTTKAEQAFKKPGQ